MNTNKKIFISGMPRSGKTSMIIKLIEEFGYDKFYGFYTKEIRENKERKGFKIVLINENKEFLLAHTDIKSETRYGKYYIFVNNINKVVNWFLEKYNIGKNKICIVDEIGPMELTSQEFNKIVKIVVQNDIYCIAVIHRKMLDIIPFYFWVSRENWWDIYNRIKRIVKNWIKELEK